MRYRSLAVAAIVFGAVNLGCGIFTGPNSDSLAIQRFLATPDHVDASGGKVTLLWSVEGAESVSIDNGVGDVDTRGTVQVSPSSTTTYTLTALGGSSTATSTVMVVVGKPASPAPSPSPRTSPSPSPSPGPSPTPSPSATPSPSPSAGPTSCGTQAAPPDTCRMVVEMPTSPTAGECVQLTRITAIPGCPVSVGMTGTITFDINAQSSTPLTWRRAAGGRDAVTPSIGSLLARGQSTVTATAVVYDTSLAFEVVDATGRVLLRFTLQHQ
jgi:hypothetical protein